MAKVSNLNLRSYEKFYTDFSIGKKHRYKCDMNVEKEFKLDEIRRRNPRGNIFLDLLQYLIVSNNDSYYYMYAVLIYLAVRT